jgi:hypothetical protein
VLCLLRFIGFLKTALPFLCNKECLTPRIIVWYSSGIHLEGPRKISYGYPAFISPLPNVLGVSCCLSDRGGSDSLSSFHSEWTKSQRDISSRHSREKRDFLLLKLINNPLLRASPNPNLYTSSPIFQGRYQPRFNAMVNMDCFKLEKLVILFWTLEANERESKVGKREKNCTRKACLITVKQILKLTHSKLLLKESV